MIIPNQIQKLIQYTDNGKIWIFIILFFILSYLIISLFTWSFSKPLKYLGIPTLILGILLLLIRFIFPLLLDFIPINNNYKFIEIILPSVLKPLLFISIGTILFSILMIIISNVINNNKIINQNNQ